MENEVYYKTSLFDLKNLTLSILDFFNITIFFYAYMNVVKLLEVIPQKEIPKLTAGNYSYYSIEIEHNFLKSESIIAFWI